MQNRVKKSNRRLSKLNVIACTAGVMLLRILFSIEFYYLRIKDIINKTISYTESFWRTFLESGCYSHSPTLRMKNSFWVFWRWNKPIWQLDDRSHTYYPINQGFRKTLQIRSKNRKTIQTIKRIESYFPAFSPARMPSMTALVRMLPLSEVTRISSLMPANLPTRQLFIVWRYKS